MRNLFPVLLLAAAGCVDAPEGVDLDVGTTIQAATREDCPDFMCGSNSPEIDNLGLHELHRWGERNDSGFKLEYARKDGFEYRVRVKNGVIEAYRADGYVLPPRFTAGLEMKITNDTVPGLVYWIRVASVDLGTRFRAQVNGTSPTMISYVLEWSAPQDPAKKEWKNICSDVTPDDTLGLPAYQSVVFEGDRISARDKTVYDFDTNWFNIGCAGHALSKLHATGHTHAAQAAGFETTRDERTTMLKMLAADYCGDGSSFTVPGVELTWADHRDTMNFSPLFAPVEARWSVRGAECLNTPRVIANPTETSVALFGTDAKKLRERINLQCAREREVPIPFCNTRLDTHLVSGNP